MHNALKQVTLNLPSYSLRGFSISGLATYIQAPEFDLCFDIGECPLSAVPLNHVFLSHAHGDHARCLMRHFSLRKMLGIEREASYYLPDFLVEPAKNWIHAEALFEGVAPERIQYPDFVGLSPRKGRQFLTHRKDLTVKCFSVRHSLPSVGYTIESYKKKLKDEYLGLPGNEIARLRQEGIVVQREVYEPRLTFIGDCIGRSLWENPDIWKSETLILECTFIDADEEKMAQQKGHTHLQEIVRVLQEFESEIQCKHIILKHFSMKYTREHVLRRVREEIPETFADRILLLV